MSDTVPNGAEDQRPDIDANGQWITYADELPVGHCPVCLSNDAAMRVSAVVSAGTTHSSGTAGAVTFGWDSAGHSAGSAYTAGNYQHTAQTALAKRLEPPARPAGVGCLFAIVAVVLFFGVQILCYPVLGVDAYFVSVPAIVAGLYGLVAFRRTSGATARLNRRRRGWAVATQELWAAYYCHRDDVVFGLDVVNPLRICWAPPEQWVQAMFRYRMA